jgi:hypothetical protein
MQSPGFSLSWIVTFVVVIIVVGVLLGASMAGTDLFNFNSSAADMRAKDEATSSQAQKSAIDLRAYQVEQEAKIAAQQQAVTFQTFKSAIDQQTYRIQQTAQAMRQVADSKQYEAQQLAQAEAARQKQLADIEIQRERGLAEVRAQEQSQAQARAEQVARTAQDLKSANLLSSAAALAVIVIAVAVAAVVIFGTVTVTWPRLQRARLELAAAKAAAQSQIALTAVSAPVAHPQPIRTAAPELMTVTTAPAAISDVEREYRKQQRIQARAVEIAMRSIDLKQQTVPSPVIEQNPTAQDVGTWFRKSGNQPVVASEPEQPTKPAGRLS